MTKKLIGLFEVGGLEDGKKPSEMTDSELEAWSEVLTSKIMEAVSKKGLTDG